MAIVTGWYRPDDVRVLLSSPEGQVLEFKSLFDRSGDRVRSIDRRKIRDLVAENVAAFANAEGGTLLLGVEDDGTPSGHRLPRQSIDELLKVVGTRLRPAVTLQLETVELDEVEVIVIEVPVVPEAVMVEGNGFPYRVNDQVVREPQEVINERKQAYRRVGFEQRVHPEATLDDLDLDLVPTTLMQSVGAGHPADEALARRGLVHLAGRGTRVTNAALLLFGRPPFTRWHPRAGVRVFRVDGTERRHGANRNVEEIARLETPISSLVHEAFEVIQPHIHRPEKLTGIEFKAVPEYPDFAWQEALVNAIAHRDYGMQGLEVEVWLYDDRMEVRSPGDLLPPVTVESLTAGTPAHVSRNPLVVRALVEAGFMREVGEGVPRMIEEMHERFLSPPSFSLEGDVFTVTLFNNPALVRAGQFADSQPVLQRLPDLARLLRTKPSLSNSDYRELFGVPRYVAARELQRLVREGFLVLEGQGRGTKYRPGPKLTGGE